MYSTAYIIVESYIFPALYQSMLKHRDALKSLQREHKKHLEREETLSQILDTLRRSYNPNYQDMAVLDAVRGWEYLAGLPHINDVGKDKDASEDGEEGEEEETVPEEVIPEGEWTVQELDKDLPKLLKTDYVSLLLEHEDYIKSPAEGSLCTCFLPFTDIGVFIASSVFEISNYLPESLIPQYEDFKDTILGVLESIGIIRPSSSASVGMSFQS